MHGQESASQRQAWQLQWKRQSEREQMSRRQNQFGIKEGDKGDLMFGLCPLVCCVLPALIVPFALVRWA